MSGKPDIWGIAGIAAQFLFISTKTGWIWTTLGCPHLPPCTAVFRREYSKSSCMVQRPGSFTSACEVSWHEDTHKSSTFLGFSSINQPFRIPHVWNPPYLCYNISMTGYALRYIFRGLHSMRSPWFVSLALLLVETTYVSRFSFCDCAVSISTCHCHVLPRSSSW
jgi:hypothetical protein